MLYYRIYFYGELIGKSTLDKETKAEIENTEGFSLELIA